MLLSELSFAAPLAYSPRGESAYARASRELRDDLKADRVRGAPPRGFAIRLAEYLSSGPLAPHFASLFGRDVALVPVPRSALQRPGDLWVPSRLAEALLAAGLGGDVVPLLRRVAPLPKAARSDPRERPLPQHHFETLALDARLIGSARLLLIDDVVTRGATLLGAASRVVEAYPALPVAAFAVLRTISDPALFRDLVDPVFGRIELRPQGDTLRRP